MVKLVYQSESLGLGVVVAGFSVETTLTKGWLNVLHIIVFEPMTGLYNSWKVIIGERESHRSTISHQCKC